jgi:hypothetical protein
MSVNKLRKYLDTLPDPLTGTKTLTPVLLSDSKGLYLEKHILPGVDLSINVNLHPGYSSNIVTISLKFLVA